MTHATLKPRCSIAVAINPGKPRHFDLEMPRDGWNAWSLELRGGPDGDELLDLTDCEVTASAYDEMGNALDAADIRFMRRNTGLLLMQWSGERLARLRSPEERLDLDWRMDLVTPGGRQPLLRGKLTLNPETVQ